MNRLGKLFTVSVAVVTAVTLTFGLFADRRSPTVVSAMSVPPAPAALDPDMRFKNMGATDGITAEEYRFSTEIYEAPDGVGLFLTRQYCLSVDNAERALRLSLRDATEVFEETRLVDGTGKPVGYRVIALFNSPEEPKLTPTILWTDRDTFYILNSSSFPHSLLLEKRFFYKAPQ